MYLVCAKGHVTRTSCPNLTRRKRSGEYSLLLENLPPLHSTKTSVAFLFQGSSQELSSVCDNIRMASAQPGELWKLFAALLVDQIQPSTFCAVSGLSRWSWLHLPNRNHESAADGTNKFCYHTWLYSNFCVLCFCWTHSRNISHNLHPMCGIRHSEFYHNVEFLCYR